MRHIMRGPDARIPHVISCRSVSGSNGTKSPVHEAVADKFLEGFRVFLGNTHYG